MKIVTSYPPNIDEIRAVFGARALTNAVFTYGDTIHTPKGTGLDAALIEHEAIHIKQQEDGAEKWWAQYLADPGFRLEQEIEAYRAQYQYAGNHWNREQRRRLLKKIIKDLSSPLYGSIISSQEAKEAITA